MNDLKSTGITRSIDDLGRVVLPKDLRERYDIQPKDTLEVFTTEDGILLKKYNPGCEFCGGFHGIEMLRGKKICRDCIEKVKEM